MSESLPQTPADRLRIAFELHELAETMLRQGWSRRHPEATPEDVDAAVRAWLGRRPGAEHGDSQGRPVPWPRTE